MRLDEDIVAKASFYAGLATTFAPEELPDDIRTNGNSLLRDVVNSVCESNEVDRGQVVVKVETKGQVHFSFDSGITPCNVIKDGKELTLVGLTDFMTEYRNNTNVCCIHHSVVSGTEDVASSIIVDEFGKVLVDEKDNFLIGESVTRGVYYDVISVKTWCEGELEIVCDKMIKIDNTKPYLRIDCRDAVRTYIIDFLSYRMASLYKMDTIATCNENMQLSLKQCKKVIIPHQSVADPILGMRRMMNNLNSPSRKSVRY